LIASFIMVMWDLSMDPARATVNHAWIWHDGGGYFGVPFSNFLGWFLCVYTIFQLLAIYLIRDASAGRAAKAAKDNLPDTSKTNWHQANAMHAATSLEFVFLGFFPPKGTVTDATQQVWQLSAMYESMGLVALFTMVFVSVLVFFKVKANAQLT
jgi:putative membrane protein